MEVKQEDTEILKNYLNKHFLAKDSNIQKPIHLIVRPDCNQKCEYCYLYQHGKELYPLDQRKDKQGLLKNLKILLNYFKEQDIFENFWELFAGDMFYDNIWFDIMDLFYDYFSYMKNKQTIPVNKENAIIIPCNMSFCEDLEKIKKVKEYVHKFRDDLDMSISFSGSIDGKYATDVREKKEVSDEFYDRLFTLMKEEKWEFHPMISYEGIKNSLKNYKWWREQYEKYFMSEHFALFAPPFLEVRNDGWTDEHLNYLIKLLDYAVEDRYKLLDYDIKKFTKHLFFPEDYVQKKHIIPHQKGNDIILLNYRNKDDNVMRCSLGFFLSINLADLSFPPCHRLNYSFFKGGHFVVENDKIVDITADEGINGFLLHKITNTHFNLDCYGCENRYFCKKGCRGAQFEYSTEAFLPIPSVCKMLNTEINFLVKKYVSMGVFDELFMQTEYKLEPDYKKHLIELLSTKGYPEYEYKYY